MSFRVLPVALCASLLLACGAETPERGSADTVSPSDDTSGGDAGVDVDTSDEDTADDDTGQTADTDETADTVDAGGDAEFDTMAAAECGNAVVEAGELCDGTALGGAACTDFAFAGGTLGCSDDCLRFVYDECTARGTCGDDTAEGDELCDGADLRDRSCADFGFGGGTLICADDCNAYHLGTCTSEVSCGDDTAAGSELCDGTDLRDATCADFGFDGGTLACAVDCSAYSFAGCTFDVSCGDDTASGDEVCDGTDLRDRSCTDLGFAGGTLGCEDDCAGYDVSGCAFDITCGDDDAEGAELCDGDDLRSANCGDLGFAGGTLACADDCAGFVTDACTFDIVCGDDVAAGTELCDGTDLRDTACTDLGFLRGTLACADGCGAWVLDGCSNDPVCGDETAEVTELCDGGDVRGVSCTDFGFDSGTLICADGCDAYDFADCAFDVVCGDDVAEGSEVCDGVDLRGANCRTRGYDGGELACETGCAGYDVSACTTTCIPDCSGRVCGLDARCGTSCGTCDDGFTCTAGRCEGDGTNPPTIVTLGVNRTRLTEGDTVRFSAIVTDVDGIDDVIGGTLTDPVSGNTYGSFATAASEGAYQIDLRWDEIHDVRSIDFVVETSRVFTARFFDVGGNSSTRDVTITLFCDVAALSGACNGVCTNLTRTSSCGTCETVCPGSGLCVPEAETYACVCPEDRILCGGSCVTNDAPPNCGVCGETCTSGGPDTVCAAESCVCPAGSRDCDGTCDNAYLPTACGPDCDLCAANQWCDGVSCRDTAEGSVRLNPIGGWAEMYHSGQWKAVCGDGGGFDWFGSAEATIFCKTLGGRLLTYYETSSLPSTVEYWGTPHCWGDESRMLECMNSTTWDDSCTDRGVMIWCAVDRTGGCTADPSRTVRINEVYSGPAPENDFVELIGDPGERVGDMNLAFYGATGNRTIYSLLDSGLVIPASGYLVLDVGNVPDAGAVVLEECAGAPVDAVAYGVDPDSGAAARGELSVAVAAYTTAESIGRRPGEADTDDNFTDFYPFATPTPGGPNMVFDTPIVLPDTFSMGFTGGVGSRFSQPSETCGSTGNSRIYDVRSFTNTSDGDLHVDIFADWAPGVDGFVHAYRGAFTPGAPTSNCVGGNDDGFDNTVSRLDRIAWPAGEELTVVVSGWADVADLQGDVTLSYP